MSAWMIRAGHGGVYAEDWLDKGKIGIGWDFGSKDIASMKREQIRATYLAAPPFCHWFHLIACSEMQLQAPDVHVLIGSAPQSLPLAYCRCC